MCLRVKLETVKARDLLCCARNRLQIERRSLWLTNQPATQSLGDKGKILDFRTMNRSVLYLVIGALAVVAAVFGYQLYQERQKTTGIEINVGKGGISIEKK
jgi:hypothetical protein